MIRCYFWKDCSQYSTSYPPLNIFPSVSPPPLLTYLQRRLFSVPSSSIFLLLIADTARIGDEQRKREKEPARDQPTYHPTDRVHTTHKRRACSPHLDFNSLFKGFPIEKEAPYCIKFKEGYDRWFERSGSIFGSIPESPFILAAAARLFSAYLMLPDRDLFSLLASYPSMWRYKLEYWKPHGRPRPRALLLLKQSDIVVGQQSDRYRSQLSPPSV